MTKQFFKSLTYDAVNSLRCNATSINQSKTLFYFEFVDSKIQLDLVELESSRMLYS